jgi:signal transduction histidine kinase
MSEGSPAAGVESTVHGTRPTAETFERRKSFLGFDANDERRLRLARELTRGHEQATIGALHRHLLAFDETRTFFSGPEEVERLVPLQVRYLDQLLLGPYDLGYAEERARLGAVHERVGLEVKHYLGGYCLLLSELARPLAAAPIEPAEKLAIFQSLLKVVFLDLGLAIDIYVVRREEELRLAIRELETFNYSVSHDLRAPLRAIIGFSQALVEDAGDSLDEGSRSHLQFIVQGALRMAHLIEGLQALSRVTRAEMVMQALCISELAEAVAAPLMVGAAERVELRIEPGIWATGDARLIPVMLQNLLDNAFKFTSHHEKARVEVGATERDGALVAYVRDDGAGFDMAHANRLFGAFQRLHLETEFEGTGVGLATVMRIVRRHGGQVIAESRPEEGATFYFTLPDLRRE